MVLQAKKEEGLTTTATLGFKTAFCSLAGDFFVALTVSGSVSISMGFAADPSVACDDFSFFVCGVFGFPKKDLISLYV
jgi:hypothetical protein